MLGPAEVSWAELALDYEAFAGRALPASPDHRLRGTRLPLGEHCRDSWVRCLRAPARMRPPLGDRFLMDYYPRPLEGGPPLLPYARRHPRAPPRSIPLAAPQRSRPPGAGSGTRRALLGAWGTIVPQVQKPGLGHQPLLPCRTRGARRPAAGLRCLRAPPRVAPGR